MVFSFLTKRFTYTRNIQSQDYAPYWQNASVTARKRPVSRLGAIIKARLINCRNSFATSYHRLITVSLNSSKVLKRSCPLLALRAHTAACTTAAAPQSCSILSDATTQRSNWHLQNCLTCTIASTELAASDPLLTSLNIIDRVYLRGTLS